MEVLILGAGRVGSAVARTLVGYKCNVTVVDTDPTRLHQLQMTCDLLTIQGSAADPGVLTQAHAADASLVIAVTGNDAVNLIACKLCALQDDIPQGSTRIARLRNTLYNEKHITSENGFGITQVFFSDRIIAESICNSISHPGTFSVSPFAGGRVVLAGMRISPQTDFAGETISHLRTQIPEEIDYRIVSVYRDNKPILPTAETRLFVADDAYILAKPKDLDLIVPYLAGDVRKNERIIIAGGGNIGSIVAENFENEDLEVKVIDVDMERCKSLSKRLKNTTILRGRATDERLLTEEGIGETDMFCGLTNIDEENIMSAILAKQLGARQAAAIVNHPVYSDILERQLDIALSPIQLIIGSILANIRLADIPVVHSLRRGSAEAVEAVIHGDKSTSKVVGRQLQEINFPKNVMPGAVVRGEQTIIAHDDTEIMENDRLICFVPSRDSIKPLEKLLQVGFLHYQGKSTTAPSPTTEPAAEAAQPTEH